MLTSLDPDTGANDAMEPGPTGLTPIATDSAQTATESAPKLNHAM